MASSLNADFSDFLTYVPSGGDLLLSSVRHTVYSIPGTESLYAIADTFLTNFTWDQVFSFVNHTASEPTRTIAISRGLTITEGSEVSREFGLSGSFRGIGINFGASSKSFQNVETSEVSTTTTEITLLPNATTRYFQRLYRFRTRVWYILDAWSELSQVGGLPRFSGDRNFTVTYSEARHEIKSQDFFLTHVALNGQGTFAGTANPPPVVWPFKWTRQFQNTTPRCQNYLRGLANRGMANISGLNVARSADKNEGEGAEYIGQGHPPDESQDKIVCISKRTSDAPPDEELPAATAEN